MSRLLLASQSPRRAELLEAAGISFDVLVLPEVDETPPAGAAPREVVCQLAARKLRAAARMAPCRRILAADTLVFLDGRIMGKPAHPEAAGRMLRALSGRRHEVLTGVAVGMSDHRGDVRVRAVADGTFVSFRSLSSEEIDAYVAGGEPLDKAGAYGIQGGAAAFVAGLEGDIDTVIGLPIQLVRRLLGDLAPPKGASGDN